MEAIFLLIPVSVVIVFFALAAFVWSVNHHQFEDLEKEGLRVLMDDDDGSIDVELEKTTGE